MIDKHRRLSARLLHEARPSFGGITEKERIEAKHSNARNSLETVKTAELVTLYEHGYIIYTKKYKNFTNCTVQGYYCIDGTTAAIELIRKHRRNVPIVDTRDMPNNPEAVMAILRSPSLVENRGDSEGTRRRQICNYLLYYTSKGAKVWPGDYFA